jgi:uncharacterized protein involved in response to NO
MSDGRIAPRRAGPNLPVASPAPARGSFSPIFLVGSLALTLTLGATMGMIHLLRGAAGAAVLVSHRQIHAHTQIVGFAALFLMGIAYHALPRILGVGGEAPRSARAVFWLMAGGVLLRNAGQPLGAYPAGRALSLLSGACEVAGGALFAWFVFDLLGRARTGKYDEKDPLRRFVRAGTVYFCAAIALSALQAVWLAGHVETALPADLTDPFYFTALYGFLLAWIFGFGNRVVALFLGVGPARRGSPLASLLLQAGGVAAALAAAAPGVSAVQAAALGDASISLVALAALVYLAGSGLVWRRPRQPALPVPGSPSIAIRTAFGALGLWAVLELAGVAIARTGVFPAQNPWWTDAARHLFTIGFLTLLIVGMSIRVLPVFTGRRLRYPAMAKATYALIVLGAALRLLQYPAAFNPVFYRIGAFMGVPVVLALLLFVFNLLRTMAPAHR